MLDVSYLAKLIAVVLDGTPFPDLDRALPLLLGTAAHESKLRYTRQLGGGPARGYWQMEGATERDHWLYLDTHAALLRTFAERSGVEGPSVTQLECNLPYQILLVRLHYYRRDAQRLPAPTDLQAQAQVWKTYYNSNLGKGTVQSYMNDYRQIIAPHWPAAARSVSA